MVIIGIRGVVRNNRFGPKIFNTVFNKLDKL